MAQNDPNKPQKPPPIIQRASAPLPTVSNHTVFLDGAAYTGTRFENCTMVYGGGQLPFLQNNEYINCQWRLDGPASNTLDFMRFMISVGGQDLVLRGLGLEVVTDGQQ